MLLPKVSVLEEVKEGVYPEALAGYILIQPTKKSSRAQSQLVSPVKAKMVCVQERWTKFAYRLVLVWCYVLVLFSLAWRF